jgi:hypothetical protein
MKKYIFTEQQIKKVVDHVLEEQSTDIRSTVMTSQCFLNHPKIMNAKLVVDGKAGPGSQTEKVLKAFQMKKKVWPVDGVWGYQTQSTLTPFEAKVWEMCRKKYEIR